MWWQEAADHMTSTTRKQNEVNAGVQFTFFTLFSLGSQIREWYYLDLGWICLPTSVALIFILLVILEIAKQTP